ncbi:hypothetical protein [Acetobacter senegalensis]|uniref:hypothetical protein n=1 Tax=Acetobacter senegalensis TaxID=446692 RepID=UPI00264ED7A9|nr:hypothetical protein [Acetobacter senegalensis]MDN7351788.1 hypothetical protein [Acetobacter senegalensis]
MPSVVNVVQSLRNGAQAFQRRDELKMTQTDCQETSAWLETLAAELEGVAHFAGIRTVQMPVVIDAEFTEVRA